MKIIGLTGGIASGKNFVAEIFAKKGAAVFDADAEVHKLLGSDRATLLEVKRKFPESFIEQKIDRKILGKIVFSDAKKLKILEKILHPKVRKKYLEFLQEVKKSGKNLALLNIPLLLESKNYKCDLILAVVAPKAIRKKRFLAREKKKNPKNFVKEKKNLEKRFARILLQQLDDSERKKYADFVIKNGISKANSTKQIEKFLQIINHR